MASPGVFNMYLYDGAHEHIDQAKAFYWADPTLADVFIAVVDDWNYPPVQTGTAEVECVGSPRRSVWNDGGWLTRHPPHPTRAGVRGPWIRGARGAYTGRRKGGRDRTGCLAQRALCGRGEESEWR